MSDEELSVNQEEDLDEQEGSPSGVEDDGDETAEEELSAEEKVIAKLKEAITIKREVIGALREKITITVPQEMLTERQGEQFLELKREADIPGFRKGHAPLRLVEKRFGSDVGDQILSEVISSGYLAAVEKEGIKPLGDPLFWVKVDEERTREDGKIERVKTEKLVAIDKALDHLKMPSEGSLTFSCEVELTPEFDLPKLEKIPLKRPAVSIDDDDVETELKRMRMSRGTYSPVEDGAVETDDLLYADVKMSVDGDVISREVDVALAARDSRVNGVPVTGLGEALTGKKAGEQVTVEAKIPDDYENIDVRDKTAIFEFTIHEIKRLELPPIDDEFLSPLGVGSEKELRDAIRSQLESTLENIFNRTLRDQIGLYLVDNTTLEIPERLSQSQTDRSIARRRIEMLRSGVPEAEIDKSLDEMRAEAQEQAVRDLKLFFILDKIAEDRDVKVSEERLNGAIAMIAQRANKRFDRVRDELSKADGLRTLYMQLRDEEILDALLADAEITETEGPKKKKSTKKPAKKTVKKSEGAETGKKKTTKTAAKKKAAKKSS